MRGEVNCVLSVSLWLECGAMMGIVCASLCWCCVVYVVQLFESICQSRQCDWIGVGLMYNEQ